MNKIKTTLYNGEIELLFQPYGHKYSIENKSVRSVTKVLSIIAKPALVGWASRMAVEHMQENIKPGETYDEVELMTIFDEAKGAHYKKKTKAGQIGRFVHNWVEDYINGKNPTMPENKQLQKAINKFLDWQKEHNVEFLLSEQQVYSRKYNYTGTLDFICKIDDKLYIGDLKTSSGIYPEMMIQTSAYRYARCEEYPNEDYAGQIIVKVGKEDGALEVAVVDDDAWYAKMLTGFLAALKLTESMEAINTFKPSKI